MTLILISLLAGILSVLAPCIISIIPLLIGYSAESKTTAKAVRVVAGLAISIFIFSLLLKASALLISVSNETWQVISGGIIILFGITGLFPSAWEFIAAKLRLQQLSAKGQKTAISKGGIVGDLLLGASLGPIFSACSPTYALIIASILPVSPIKGIGYLLVFILGLSLSILLIATLGQKAVLKLGWSINPHGWFKRALAIFFIVVGVMIITGYDKTLLTHLVENGWFDWQVALETKFQY